MIKANQITQKFENKVLFNELNIEIEKGDFCVITGKSGSGKSTLMNILSFLEIPTEGEVLFEGKKVTNDKQKVNLYGNKISFLFQNYALINNETVKKNLEYIKKIDEKILSLLSEYGLADKLDDTVATLSGGEQQRLALVRMLMQDHDCLFADEPTGNLDNVNRDLVINNLIEMNKKGKTIIMITHDQELFEIGNKRINLDEIS